MSRFVRVFYEMYIFIGWVGNRNDFVEFKFVGLFLFNS